MTQPTAYSYLRFSDPSQAHGDSRRRQTTAAAKYAADHGLVLDDSMRDEGVSAFRGRHREEGALGAFLAKVESGEIKPGSFLLIDSFDRLTRERVTTAMHLLTGIMARGVTVVTLNDGRRYADASAGLHDLMYALMEFSRAHNESALKSERVRDALRIRRENARREGRPWAQRWPFWLKQTGDGFTVLDDRADDLRRIFDLKIEGMGNAAIAKRLNAGDVAPPNPAGWRPSDVTGVLEGRPGLTPVRPDARALIHELNAQGVHPRALARRLNDDGFEPPRKPCWHEATVAKLLASRSVFGEFQPHVLDGDKRRRVPEGDPIPDYYPVVVSRAKYEAARAVVEARATSNARPQTTEFRNLLVGLVRCARCGGTAGFWQSTRPSKPHLQPHQVIRCNAVNAGACNNRTRLNYRRLETELLAYVGGLPIPERDSKVAAELAAKRAERADLNNRIQRLLDLVEGGAVEGDDAAERLRARRAERDALDGEIKRLARIERAERAAPSAGDWRAVMGRLISDLAKADDAERYAIRAQINTRLGQAVVGGFTLGEGRLLARFSTADPKGGKRPPLYYGAEGGMIAWEFGGGGPDFDQVQVAPGALIAAE